MEEVKETKAMIKEVKSLPVVAVSLIVSVITLILAFIFGVIWFIIGYSAIYQLSTLIISLNNETATIVNSVAGSITAMGALYLIIIWPIEAFIGAFILTAIIALLYNFLAPRIGGIKLELE